MQARVGAVLAMVVLAAVLRGADGECYNACPFGRRLNSCRCLDRESITTCESRNCRLGYHCLVINGEARCKPNSVMPDTSGQLPPHLQAQNDVEQSTDATVTGVNSSSAIFLLPHLLIVCIVVSVLYTAGARAWW